MLSRNGTLDNGFGGLWSGGWGCSCRRLSCRLKSLIPLETLLLLLLLFGIMQQHGILGNSIWLLRLWLHHCHWRRRGSHLSIRSLITIGLLLMVISLLLMASKIHWWGLTLRRLCKSKGAGNWTRNGVHSLRDGLRLVGHGQGRRRWIVPSWSTRYRRTMIDS